MVKQRPKEPITPPQRTDTVRHEIISAIQGQPMSAREISGTVRIPEKEVYEHLQHIQKSLLKKERRLLIAPAECLKCGFIFRKRDRLQKPGKCPVCRSESIQDPLFEIRGPA